MLPFERALSSECLARISRKCTSRSTQLVADDTWLRRYWNCSDYGARNPILQPRRKFANVGPAELSICTPQFAPLGEEPHVLNHPLYETIPTESPEPLSPTQPVLPQPDL